MPASDVCVAEISADRMNPCTNRYYECHNGLTTLRLCHTDYIFDADILACLPAHLAKCSKEFAPCHPGHPEYPHCGQHGINGWIIFGQELFAATTRRPINDVPVVTPDVHCIGHFGKGVEVEWIW